MVNKLGPSIVAVGTALPQFCAKQEEVRAFAHEHFVVRGGINSRYLTIYDNAAVDRRFAVHPVDWLRNDATFKEINDQYIESAIELGSAAVEGCLNQVGLSPKEVDTIIFVSSSGICTPSIDTHIANRLKFRTDVKRYPLFGLGCAGGAAAISLAARLVRESPSERALVVAFEANSMTFQRSDFSLDNLVSTALFGDGAAAVLIAGCESGIHGRLVFRSSKTLRFPDTSHAMGWDFRDTGFKVVVTEQIPKLAGELFKSILASYRADGIEIRSFILHPGGVKVLESFEHCTGLPEVFFSCSRDVLRNVGNLSSPTVLFVLEQKFNRRQEWDKSFCLLGAFGPGFTAEVSLFEWMS